MLSSAPGPSPRPPRSGAPQALPSRGPVPTERHSPGRIGAGGVYLFYGQGYPTFKTLALWKVDTAKPQLVIKADRNEHANVAAAPDGRLWLMWEQNGTIYAARTNRSATKVGAVNAIRPPSGASIYRLNGEGSAGRLDLIANMQAGGGQALWHQQVWPKLSLTGSRSGTRSSSASPTPATRSVEQA